MNLLHYLTTRQIDELQNIAVRVGCYGMESSKQRLVSGIARKLTQSDGLRSILEDLSSEAFEILRFLVVRRSPELAPWESTNSSDVERLATFRAAIRELLHFGLVGLSPDPRTGHSTHALFEDLVPHLQRVIGEDLPKPFQQAKTPRTVHSLAGTWLADAITLLGYASRVSIRTTKRGQPVRRETHDLEQLLRGMRHQELYQRMTGGSSDWLERLVIVLAANEAIDTGDGILRVLPGAFEKAAFLLPGSGPDALLALPGSLPLLYNFSEYISVASLLLSGGSNSWMKVEPLRDAISPNLPLFRAREGWDSLYGALFDLAALGLCDLGEQDGEWSWRLRPAEEEIPAGTRGLIHIQPNFEIVAPSQLPVDTRFVLEEIAELFSVEQLLHYRITKETAYHAFTHGWSAERQIGWLEDQLGERRQVPQNVRSSLESWGSSFGRVSLEIPFLLVCDTPELAELLLHSKELAALTLGLFAPNALVLRQGKEAEAFAALRRMGQMPLPEIGDGTRRILVPSPHKQGKAKGSKDWEI